MAIAFKIKITPIEVATLKGEACRIGAIAPIALPPQIALPLVSSVHRLVSILKSLLSKYPEKKTIKITVKVSRMPFRPREITALRLRLAPNKTTLNCKIVELHLLADCFILESLGKTNERMIPMIRVTCGEKN